MRKSISILLTITLLFNIGGYYLYFSFLQFNIKERIEIQIKNGLQEKDLAVIVVPVNKVSGVNWLEPEKEFSYRGEMYDIVSSKVKGQSKIYYCINDRKEKQLIEIYQKSHPSKKDTDKKLRNVMNDRYLSQQSTRINFACYLKIQYAILTIPFTSSPIQIPSPPPKVV